VKPGSRTGAGCEQQARCEGLEPSGKACIDLNVGLLQKALPQENKCY